VSIKPSITLVLILAFFASQAEIYPQNSASAFPRLEPDAKALEYFELGRRSGGYTWLELAEISLWASGDSSASNLDKIKAVVSELNNSPDLPNSGKERAEFILTFLHRNILRSYSILQTRVDTVFSNGVYNCVSSAVLYIILCESAGIRTSGVITKDHAFVIVHIGSQDFDVETTNRFGFDPGNKREFHDSSGRITGFSYVPPQNYRDRQTINKIELVSLILNNRIADFEKRSRFIDAVPLSIDRAALLFGNALSLSSEVHSDDFIFVSPRKDLIDRLINFGTTLLKSNREEDSIRWAEIASSRYPSNEHWQEFLFAAVNNRITRFVRDRKISDAIDFLEKNKTFLIEKNYMQLDHVLTDADILHRANLIKNTSEGDAILNDIKAARENGKLPERRAVELLTFTIQKTASVLSAAPARDWRSAIRYIEAGISNFGDNRELQQSLQSYKNNLATDYHNRFAAEWNRRNYDEAEKILNEGLAEFPTNRQLLTNKETVNRHRAR